MLAAVTALIWLITAVAVASHGKIAVSEVSTIKVSSSKSISAPPEMILKCVVLQNRIRNGNQ